MGSVVAFTSCAKPSNPNGSPAEGLLLGKTGETTAASAPARSAAFKAIRSWAAMVIR